MLYPVDLRDKFAGVVFGTAIGDALGFPIEFMSYRDIRSRWEHGVEDFVAPAIDLKSSQDDLAAGDSELLRTYALYSDDTQLMRACLDGLIRARPVTLKDLDRTAEEIAEELIAWVDAEDTPRRAPGECCLHGARQLKEGKHWREAGKLDGRGCGAAMRSMAYGIWFWNNPEVAAEFAAQHAQMTHISAEGMGSAAAVAAGTAALIMGFPRADAAVIMREQAGRFDKRTADLITVALSMGLDRNTRSDLVLAEWPGWTGAQAVAASVFCFMRGQGNYKGAVLTAINTGGDSDSIGAITGALAGAHLGLKGIPNRWVDRIEKKRELALYAADVIRARGYANNEPLPR